MLGMFVISSSYLFYSVLVELLKKLRSSLICQIHSQVISGIEASVRTMKVGGIQRVIIPPSQGYQSTSQEPIPPNVFILFSSDLAPLLLFFKLICSFGRFIYLLMICFPSILSHLSCHHQTFSIIYFTLFYLDKIWNFFSKAGFRA